MPFPAKSPGSMPTPAPSKPKAQRGDVNKCGAKMSCKSKPIPGEGDSTFGGTKKKKAKRAPTGKSCPGKNGASDFDSDNF